MPYMIEEKTLALIPRGKQTKILEYCKEIIEDKSTRKIVEYNCYINGSTLEGRRHASSYLIGDYYKTPIIIDESKKIILIPTHSDRNPECIWLVLNNILKYKINSENKVTVIFKNEQKLDLNVSYSIFDKQVFRATRLESAIRGRKHKKYL